MVYKAEWLSLVYGLFCLGGRFLYSVYVAQDKMLCFFEQDYVGKETAMSLTTAQRLGCWQLNISHMYICYYKLLLIPNSRDFLAFLAHYFSIAPYKAVCTATTSRLYGHYKPFVAPLQSTCSVTTKQLQPDYKWLVVFRLTKKPIARGCHSYGRSQCVCALAIANDSLLTICKLALILASRNRLHRQYKHFPLLGVNPLRINA